MITASIVLYNSDVLIIQNIIKRILESTSINHLFIIDNSPNDSLECFNNDRITKIHNPRNPGFGAAHNIAISSSLDLGSSFHFVLNPDIEFESDVIDNLVSVIESDPTIGMLMPKILNTDGSIQYLPKLLPNPCSIIFRKISFFKNFKRKYELRFVPENKIYESPLISGCFMLLRLEAIEQVGLFDDRFFMYFEDWDLTRRFQGKYKTLYYPKFEITHQYGSMANSRLKYLRIYLTSAFLYFNKWGWIFDRNRREINKKILSQFLHN